MKIKVGTQNKGTIVSHYYEKQKQYYSNPNEKNVTDK